MKRLAPLLVSTSVAIVVFALALSPGRAVEQPALPPAQSEAPKVYDIWPGTPPGEIGNIGEEKFWDKRPDGAPIPDVGGKPVKWLTNVSKPTLTVYRPAKDKDTGASMLILPGGGLTYLAWDAEGEEVAAWLNSIGVTGIIVKYRVPRRPDQMDKKFMPIWHVRPLQDAQRAVSVVRSHAKGWGLDSNRIGIIGFSAGAYLAGCTAAQSDKREYDAVDDIDKVSCRPDFAVLLYPGAAVSTLGKDCPPMFFAAAGDDGDKAEIITQMYLALKRVGVPGELHVYPSGGHDFALRPTSQPCSKWPLLCEDWLRAMGLLKVTSQQ